MYERLIACGYTEHMAQDRAWEVMDELMDSLKIVNERVYNSVMQKLTRA